MGVVDEPGKIRQPNGDHLRTADEDDPGVCISMSFVDQVSWNKSVMFEIGK